MQPRFSVVIPALHEAPTINRTIQRVNSARGEIPTEIILVDGDPQGCTLEAIEDPEVVKLTAPKGRARQMNQGARAARGEALLFLHADTLLPERGLELAARALEHCPAGAFDLHIDSDHFWLKATTLVGRNRSRITRVPYGDQAIFIRRTFFEELGGFREIPIMEDVALMRAVGKAGQPIAVLRAKARTSARRWEKEGPFYTTLRNWTLVSLYSFGVDPAKLAQFYRPHSQKNGRKTP